MSKTLSVFLHGQVLQQTGLHAWGEHDLVGGSTQWDFHVHKSQGLVGQGHKVFTSHRGQQGQHLRVQHFPGADLLLDHVEAGLVQIHVFFTPDGVLVKYPLILRGAGVLALTGRGQAHFGT